MFFILFISAVFLYMFFKPAVEEVINVKDEETPFESQQNKDDNDDTTTETTNDQEVMREFFS